MAAIDEDRLSNATFQRIATMVEEEAGIQLPGSKHVMVEGRLRRAARDFHLDGIESFCRQAMLSGRRSPEWRALLDALTTNKTDFMREPAHFDLLSRRVVPELLTQRRSRPLLKVWSAAASTGAEAWSAAMTLAAMPGAGDRFDFSVLGTDLSERVLHKAESAIYTAEELAPLPSDWRARWTRSGVTPQTRGLARIVPGLRRRARFARMNLMERDYPVDQDVDVIFLRNVLIYFDRDTQARVIAQLVSHLRPGGVLLLGHAEPFVGEMHEVETIAPASFRKRRQEEHR